MKKNSLIRNFIVVSIVILFIGTTGTSVLHKEATKNPQPIHRDWLYVGGSGPGNYTTIQSAINASNPGDTIFVFNGTYFENVLVYKTLDIIGENKTTTIIDANGSGSVVTITSNNVNISGFTIQHSGSYWSLYDRAAGIDVYASNVQIMGNNISSNGLYGIWLYDVSNVTILGNDLFYNPDIAIPFDFCSHITISSNRLAFNSYCGICIGNSSSDCIIHNNLVDNTTSWRGDQNGWGIAVANHEGNIRNVIYRNTISNSAAAGITCAFSNNTIYHNNLINNHPNAVDQSTNMWYNTSLYEGNYWSDYTGNDTNKDGIGDTPYNIPGGDNQDLYPLMHPFEWYYILNTTLDSYEVYEGTTFNVSVKTRGGPVVPNAQVLFNKEIRLTDSNGIAQFTAPMVTQDTYYSIVAAKPGYTTANATILIKAPIVAFIIGRIMNLSHQGQYITFEAVKIRIIFFSPLNFNTYVSGEKFTISRDYIGFVGVKYICALCKVLL